MTLQLDRSARGERSSIDRPAPVLATAPERRPASPLPEDRADESAPAVLAGTWGY